MDTRPSPSIRDQVDVMLHEYDTVRQHTIEQFAAYDRFVIIFTTAFSAVFAAIYQFKVMSVFVILPTIGLVFASLEAQKWFALLYNGRHLGVLERRINRLLGNDLLTWEHYATTAVSEGSLRLIDHDMKRSAVNPAVFLGLLTFGILGVLFALSLYQGTLVAYDLLQVFIQPVRIGGTIVYALVHSLLVLLILWVRFVWVPQALDLKETLWKRRWNV